MAKYLVTGGAGFIGSHITDALLKAGHEVTILDNLSTGSLDNMAHMGDNATFIEGDICDMETCLRAASGCEGIYHEAALVSVPHSIEDPRLNHDVNITGTFNVLEAARANGVKRIVYASSAAIYGDNPELPKRERMLPEPKSPYALAKLAGEHYLSNYADIFGIDAVALRYFNVFGPRQNPASPYSGVISIFVDRVLNQAPVTIFGDGEQSRDFVNVADVVQANLLAMGVHPERTPIMPRPFNVFNVATNKRTNLLELLDTLEKICGTQVDRSFKEERNGDIKHSLADIANTCQSLEYKPSVTLEDGLAELVEFVRSA